jgi:hypothetical protein
VGRGNIIVQGSGVLAWIANEALAFACAAFYVCSHSGEFMSAFLSPVLLSSYPAGLHGNMRAYG